MADNPHWLALPLVGRQKVQISVTSCGSVRLPAALVPVPASVAMPEPPDPQSPSSTSTDVPAAAVATMVPDRYDRQWPRNPPWDACPRPVWPGERSTGMPGGGRRVLVIGDSLTRDSRILTAKGMRRDGWTPTFRCWGSRRLDWGIDQVVRSRQLRQLPVVLDAGTVEAVEEIERDRPIGG